MSDISYRTQTTIIDCNRRHSSQAKSGNNDNPALFTNELGKGIKLNVGDQVSVEAVYVSEVGAGSDTIEIKGQSLGKMRTIKYTNERTAYPHELRAYTGEDGAIPMQGFNEINSINDDFEYEVKDNETYITKEYYLTLNGEGSYFNYPRRFIATDAAGTTNSSPDNWDTQSQFSDGSIIQDEASETYCNADYHEICYGNTNERVGEISGERGKLLRMRHDNSKMTLMRPMNASFTLSGLFYAYDPTTNKIDLLKKAPQPTTTDPIADLDYQVYKEIQKLSINAGFNSPEDIARTLTKQLKEAKPLDIYKVHETNTKELTRASLSIDNLCYKPFICSSFESMESTNKDYFYGAWDETDDAVVIGATSYNTNFYNVYSKRPDLRGGDTPKLEAVRLHAPYFANFSEDNVVLNIEFTEENIKKYAKFIYPQENYPELFEGLNFSAMTGSHKNNRLPVVETLTHKNTRFLHAMNYIGDARPLATGLGSDNILEAPDAGDTYGNKTYGKQSIPLFFEYQDKNKNKMTNGENLNDLAYGFAAKRSGAGGKFYIVLVNDKMGGVNPKIMEKGEDTNEWYTTKAIIGYDYHATAYGTCMAMGFTGRLKNDYGGTYNWGWVSEDLSSAVHQQGQLINQTYIGANDPVFKYDIEKSRFYWGGLHTPQLIGQTDFNAGDNWVQGTSPNLVSKSIPDLTGTTGQGLPVYKINKRINKYTYTPDMKPYDSAVNASLGYPTNTSLPLTDLASRSFSLMNRNISAWSIFDSMCGIYITDLGYDKEDFNNGLFGLLGFTYDNIFSTTTPENNRLVRVSNANISKLSSLTTNCDIVSTDATDYIVNPYGAVMFTGQLPVSMVLLETEPNPAHYYLLYPAITQATESIKIYAENLPRKMLKPYYCIRSDLIDTINYIGGEDSQSKLPVVSICDKQYSGGDFYFSNTNTITFTITKSKTISSITSSIHDPDQSYAHVNLDSSVIYRIDKQIGNDDNLAEELMNPPKK